VSNDHIVVQVFSLVMGLVAMGFTWLVSKVKDSRSILMVVLAGTVTGAFFQALISLVKYVADPETKLPAITYWLMGSIADVSFRKILLGTPPLILGMAIIVALRWRINVLSLPDDEAKALGVDVRAARWIVIVASTMITASAVSLCGQIGWVGLVVPHMSRMMVGSDHRRAVPMSAAIGAGYLLLVDTIARSATSTEIPLSILTAIIGAPFFAALLRKTKGASWS
jgi:iron complex transport system permease protein